MDLTTTTCTHRTTECPDEWVVCEERPVCVPVWQRCETTAVFARLLDAYVWVYPNDPAIVHGITVRTMQSACGRVTS